MNNQKRLLKKIVSDPELLGIYEAELGTAMATACTPIILPEPTGQLKQGRYEFEFDSKGFTGNYKQIA